MATKIRIGDVACSATYTLTGDVLDMVDSGGCADALNDHGCDVSEDMNDDEIGEAVLLAWGEGYEGDMHESGVCVFVGRGGGPLRQVASA